MSEPITASDRIPGDAAGAPARGIRAQALAYAVVGAMNAVLGYTCFCLLFYLFRDRFHYLIILTVSNVIYMVVAFFTNRRLVFRSAGPVLGQSMRFYLVYAVCVAANYAVMIALVDGYAISPMIAQVPATVVSVALGFTGNRLFTFR